MFPDLLLRFMLVQEWVRMRAESKNAKYYGFSPGDFPIVPIDDYPEDLLFPIDLREEK